MENVEIEYIKPDQERYRIEQRPPVPTVRHISLWLLIPLSLLLVLGVYLAYSALNIHTSGQTTYSVNGSVDYQVYLKENDYYSEKYLESGRQYIASLIDTVRADFDYSLEADQQVAANYTYEIVATATATDKSDASKILYTKTDVLKAGESTPITDGAIDLRDSVNIDYNKYNEYMKNFRSDFGIAANCFLDLRLVVTVDGAIQTEDALAISIPLSNQTVDISIQSNNLNRSAEIGEPNLEISTNNLPSFIVGVVLVATGLIFGIVVIYLYKTRFGDNWYAEAEYKIAKNYDTHIVNATSTYYEDGEVVHVADFVELTDASRNEGSPIIRFDVDPDYKSYYIVRSANGLQTYRYTLTRSYQDELRTTGQPKEVF